MYGTSVTASLGYSSDDIQCLNSDESYIRFIFDVGAEEIGFILKLMKNK